MSADRAEVETILGSILASEQNGLSLRRLDQEYCSVVGTSIPFEEFGHASLAAFLGSMPKVVTVEGGSGGELIARAAYNAATAHITKLVAEQKPGPIRVRRQQTQRPCHWKVHPYHKNPKRSWFEDTENSSWTRGTVPFKKEPRQGPSVSGPSNSYLLPATMSQASNSASPSLPRRPVAAASHPKVPVSSPAPVRRPLQGVPANAVQQPGGSWHSNEATTWRAPRPSQKYSAAQNYTHDYGFQKPNVKAWMWFLKKAGVVRQRALVYAKLLRWQGVNPSSMWLFTGQDIFQMGIGDFRDIHLIQEHAHQLHAMHGAASNGNLLDEAGYLNPHHEGSQEQGGACNFVHVPLRCNQRRGDNLRVTFKNQHPSGHPAKRSHNHLATVESEQWSENECLHLTPALRRCRDLRLKHGFSLTPLNLRSVVGRPSIKERLGWRH